MRRAILPALVAGLLTACAISPEQARSLSSFELCEKITAPMTTARSVGTALKELGERQENCSQFADIYATRQSANAANSAAMLGAGLAIMGQSRPVYAPPQTIVIEQQAPPQPVRFTRPYP